MWLLDIKLTVLTWNSFQRGFDDGISAFCSQSTLVCFRQWGPASQSGFQLIPKVLSSGLCADQMSSSTPNWVFTDLALMFKHAVLSKLLLKRWDRVCTYS